MADAAENARARAASDPAAAERLAAHRAVVADIVATAGGRNFAAEGGEQLASFQSAVQAMRAAVEVQETLRARNRAMNLADRIDVRLGLTIGEVADDGSEVAPETLASVAHLLSLAAPGGLCISRSVREAVASKLAIKFQDVSVEGRALDSELRSAYRVAGDTPAPSAQKAMKPSLSFGLPRSAQAGLAGLAIGAAVVAVATQVLTPAAPTPDTRNVAAPSVVAIEPAPKGPSAGTPSLTPSALAPDQKPKPTPGKIEFLPSKAPDPATVLSAERMLPKAWKDCKSPDATVAAAACKTLRDSGIPKDAELAEVQLWNGKALRDLNRLDEAMDALTASLALKPSSMAFSERGTVFFEKQAFDKAIADYTDAIRLDAANGEAFNNRAWTYFQTGHSDKALADADTAVRLLAREAYVWDTRGHINAKLGNREAAIRDFRAALAIDPKNAASRAGLASLGVN
jgi:tetratricopeptide (TPR) repeat protein